MLLREVFRVVWRILHESGTAWVSVPDVAGESSLEGVPWRLALAMQSDGWTLRNVLIWNGECSLGKYDMVLFLTKNPAYYFSSESVTRYGDIWESAAATGLVEMWMQCIEVGCPEQGVVLDPFAGNGVTETAARLTGRRFVGLSGGDMRTTGPCDIDASEAA
ncbi:DNA methyltransferase [Amycolatopsis sp. NPDC051372]|uniref:DNA methyltransferase n=1 Tax=Amycolatopsis sp. NPDC051372 TaxID=3155669 RepID=UPI0034125764